MSPDAYPEPGLLIVATVTAFPITVISTVAPVPLPPITSTSSKVPLSYPEPAAIRSSDPIGPPPCNVNVKVIVAPCFLTLITSSLSAGIVVCPT